MEHEILNQTLEPTTLRGMESLILNALEKEKQTFVSRDGKATKFWENQSFHQQRMGSQCRHQKDGGVKTNPETYQETYQELLAGKHTLVHSTVRRKYTMTRPYHTKDPMQKNKPTTHVCGIFGRHIRPGNLTPYVRNGDEAANVPLFSMGELGYVLRRMKSGRCVDTDGLFANMFKYASAETKPCLPDWCNDRFKTKQ